MNLRTLKRSYAAMIMRDIIFVYQKMLLMISDFILKENPKILFEFFKY